MMSGDVLRSSVTDLVLAFRDALLGFVPVADRLQMPWGDDSQHRDWERVAETLFDACVRGPVEADGARRAGEFLLPRYDVDVESYAEASWISVRSADQPGTLAMIRLLSDREPFDSVQAAVIDTATLRATEVIKMPIRDVDFVFVRRAKGFPDADITTIVAVE
jgi:hypothetical protein